MNPAWSVIFLTTLIGAGQGLFLALYAVDISAGFGQLAPAPAKFFSAGSGLSVALLVAGLAASFLHLGHPERAWRAAAMWRTSWLSREVIVLPAFIGAVFVYGAADHYGGASAVDRRACEPAVHCAVRLHRHDLRLPQVSAGMAHAADVDQFFPAGHRFRSDARARHLPR